MIWKVLSLFALTMVALCYADPSKSEYKIVVKHPVHHGHHGKLSHVGSEIPEHHEEYAWTYPSYEYSYHVDDPHTHDQKGQHEARYGDEVKGMYWLIQPDGRKRTVKYHADKHSGFKADVEYSEPIYGYDHEKHEHHYKEKSHEKPMSEQHVIIYYDKNKSEDKHEEKYEDKYEKKHEEHHEDENMENENNEENDDKYHEHKYYVHENEEPEQKHVIEYYENKNNDYNNDYHQDESDNNDNNNDNYDEQRIYHKHHIYIDHKYKPHYDDHGYYYGHKYD